MSYLNLRKKLSAMDSKAQLEKFLIFNTSLVLAGIKPAVTITISKKNNKIFDLWNQLGKGFIGNLSLNSIVLRENENALILFIYDEVILSKNLNQKDTIEFLRTISYPEEFNLDVYIDWLKKRYELYNCPHELGLFLGIPYKDVKDFMECSNKKCLLCGYWKVYNDFEKAESIFKKYDMVKEYTSMKISKGILTSELVKNIKNIC